MTYGRLAELVELPEASKVVAEQAEIHAKYEGYIVKQQQAVEKALKLENKKIPADFDYKKLKELSGEATEKLLQIKPDSVGQVVCQHQQGNITAQYTPKFGVAYQIAD